jgi:dienelactone hydrolase
MAVWIITLVGLFIQGKETVTFPSGDGVTITADLYAPHDKSAPMILLFHQANWSRGEYKEIAPRLNELGFNCMAIDLRSGNTVNDITNLTNTSAREKFKETRYVDALPDMMAAINYAKTHYSSGKLMLWGSSYSAALVLKIAGDHNAMLDGVLAFSPGEYFTSQGKPRNFIASSAVNIECPVFITSALNEKSNWWGMYVSISSANKAYFLPTTTGNHGSRSLWSKFPDSEQYWEAVNSFLDSIK